MLHDFHYLSSNKDYFLENSPSKDGHFLIINNFSGAMNHLVLVAAFAHLTTIIKFNFDSSDRHCYFDIMHEVVIEDTF